MKRIRKLTTAFLVIALLVTSLVSVPALAEDDDYDKVIRLAGASRYLTAVEVSKEAYDEADTVIIAAGENFPDALAASALAGVKDAPILLAEKDGFRAGTLEEIERLGAKKAIVLGGEKALGEEVVDALEDAGLKVTRIAGENRYETAALIAEEVLGTGKEVFLVNGDEPWDALAIGPVAARDGIPVLLTKAGALRDETKAFLVDNGIKTVTILGGDKAVSAAARNQIPAGISVKRVYGANREETAIEIARTYFSDIDTVIIASRQKFADALVGGYFGGKIDAPIMLVYEKKIRENVDEYLFGLNPETIYILGGEAVVSKAVADELDSYGVVTSVAAIAGQKLEKDDYLLFLVNGKWEMDSIDFGNAFGDYALSFLYTAGSVAMLNDGQAGSTLGKGKYAVEVTKDNVTIPAGGALAKDFVAFEVTDLSAIAKVTEFALFRTVDSTDVKVGALVMGDPAGYKIKALKAVTVGGKTVTAELPAFTEWTKSSNENIIAISGNDLVLQGKGNTTLSFKFAGLPETYHLVVNVNAGPRYAASIENESYKALTYPGKTFNLSVVEVLDQFGEEFTPDSVPYLVIKKGSAVLDKGLASGFGAFAQMTTAGTYTITAYTADPEANGVKLGSYTITTVVKAEKDQPKFELVFVDPLDVADPNGPRLEDLDLNLHDEIKKLNVAIKAYIKGVLLTEDDLKVVFPDGVKVGLISSKPKVADITFGTSGIKAFAVEDITQLYDYIEVSVVDEITGTTTLTLFVYDAVDGTARSVAATLNVKVVDTTPQIKTLNLKGTKKLGVQVVENKKWALLPATGQLVSPDLTDYIPDGVLTADMVALVTFYGGDTPYAVVKIANEYGGASFEFPAMLVTD